jgi:hypothetical protein
MPYPNQQDVVSSNIAKVGYDDTLYLLFNSGVAYKYYAVPKAQYLALVKAESVGSFFHKNIRGAYHHEKLEVHNF